jgi:hypothetical protein
MRARVQVAKVIAGAAKQSNFMLPVMPFADLRKRRQAANGKNEYEKLFDQADKENAKLGLLLSRPGGKISSVTRSLVVLLRNGR